MKDEKLISKIADYCQWLEVRLADKEIAKIIRMVRDNDKKLGLNKEIIYVNKYERPQ